MPVAERATYQCLPVAESMALIRAPSAVTIFDVRDLPLVVLEKLGPKPLPSLLTDERVANANEKVELGNKKLFQERATLIQVVLPFNAPLKLSSAPASAKLELNKNGVSIAIFAPKSL